MFNSSILDLVLTLSFIYFLISLIASTIIEIIHNIINRRGRQLLKALQNLYYGDDQWKTFFDDKIWKSPFIEPLKTSKLFSLTKAKERDPSYICSKNFAQAVFDILLHDSLKEKNEIALKEKNENPLTDKNGHQDKDKNITPVMDINTIKEHPDLPPKFKKTLETLWTQSENNIDRFLLNIEAYYDNFCDRVSGQFKRNTQVLLFLAGAVAVIILNVDTIFISQSLWKNKELLKSTADQIQDNLPKLEEMYKKTTEFEYSKNAATVKKLEEAVDEGTLNSEAIEDIKDTLVKNDSISKESFKDIESLYREVKSQAEFLSSISQIPIGYDSVNCFECQYLSAEGKTVTRYNFLKIFGWFITVLAIYLGAEFWFGLLNKIINIRGTGNKPEEKKEQKNDEEDNKK